ncbi:hypothetical protein D3C85_1735200 [compost metagenome]
MLAHRIIGGKLAEEIDGGIRSALTESSDDLAQFVAWEWVLTEHIAHRGDPLCGRGDEGTEGKNAT